MLAAALQGAPVTTVDVDFLFRKTPANLRKLKKVARAFDAIVLKQYYPISNLFRVMAEDLALQRDFMATVHGLRSYDSVKSRAISLDVGGEKLLVASLPDIIASKRAADRPIGRCSMPSTGRSKRRRPSRSEKLDALKLESELAFRDQIRRLLAKPPGERTHFLRKRIGIGSTCL
jgi:hypothetical protein